MCKYTKNLLESGVNNDHIIEIALDGIENEELRDPKKCYQHIKDAMKDDQKQFEVDFVVNQGSQRYYIQVAYDMTSEEKQTQELNSFRNIPDSFKKIVIVNGTKKPWSSLGNTMHKG